MQEGSQYPDCEGCGFEHRTDAPVLWFSCLSCPTQHYLCFVCAGRVSNSGAVVRQGILKFCPKDVLVARRLEGKDQHDA